MKVLISCEYDGQIGEKLIAALGPIWQQWFSEAAENSLQAFQSKLPIYVESEVFRTDCSIEAEAMWMFVHCLIDIGGADADCCNCYIGPEKNAKAMAAEFHGFMKELAFASKGPFVQIDREG